MFLLSRAEAEPSRRKLPKRRAERGGWCEPSWQISSAFRALPVTDSTPPPPDPPHPASNNPKAHRSHSDKRVKTQDFQDAAKQQKNGLCLNPVCISLIYWWWFCRKICLFTCKSNIFIKEYEKNGICKETGWQRNVHFTKAIKKSHDRMSESDLIIQAVIVPSHSDRCVGVTWASSWWMQPLWSCRHALLDPCDGESSPGHSHSCRESDLHWRCPGRRGILPGLVPSSERSVNWVPSQIFDWKATIWTEILMWVWKRAEGKIANKRTDKKKLLIW